MSWIPFRKAFSGRRTRTEDVEFERELNKLRQMQAVSRRMYKDMRKCNESETALVKAGHRIVSDIKTSPLGRSELLKPTLEVLNASMEELQSHAKTLRSNQDVTFTEPIKKFNNVYKHVEFHAKQRELKLQEFEKQQARLEKLGRKVQSQPVSQSGPLQPKLEQAHRALTSVRSDYDRVHSRLMQEMPVLYEGRVDYFDRCLQAVIKSQALYFHECSKSLQSCLARVREMEERENGVDEGGDVTMSDQEIVQTTERMLGDIQALSIVGNSPVS